MFVTTYKGSENCHLGFVTSEDHARAHHFASATMSRGESVGLASNNLTLVSHWVPATWAFNRGLYTWIAILTATAVASTATVLFARGYSRRGRRLRFGPLGEAVLFGLIWVVAFGVAYVVLFAPTLIVS
jgi:hypothetical protein